MRENVRWSTSASVCTRLVLPTPGMPFEQDVPAGEQARDRQVHDLFVADDAASDFLGDADEALAELFDGWTDGGSVVMVCG